MWLVFKKVIRMIKFKTQTDKREAGEALIRNGANVNDKDSAGGTPLLYAIVAGNFRSLKPMGHQYHR